MTQVTVILQFNSAAQGRGAAQAVTERNNRRVWGKQRKRNQTMKEKERLVYKDSLSNNKWNVHRKSTVRARSIGNRRDSNPEP